ncbi:MAG: TonB family protein [Bradymonadia bacterium]|jgi:TonB family protein
MTDPGSHKILRIGVLHGAALIEERLLRARQSVTVGQDAKNTFAMPLASLPDSYTVFDWVGGAFHLRITEAMAGKVGVGQLGADEGAVDFAKLKALGLARPHPKGGLTIALSEASRGQVKLGDLTILFQFVDPPPAPSRLQLPKAVRGGLLNTLDWPFVATLLASFAVQVFAVAFIVNQDYPEVPRPEISDRFLNPILAQMQPPAVRAPASKATNETVDPQKTAAAPTVAPRPTIAKRPTPKTSERSLMQAGVRDKTILVGVIGSQGEDASDFVEDLLGDGVSSAAMNSAFDGVGLATNGERGRDSRRDTAAIGATANLGANTLAGKGLGRTIAAEKKGAEARVRGEFKLKHIKDDDIVGGTMSPKEISKAIKRRGRAIRACYEKALGRNNALAGKVVLRFVVQESGRVSSARVAHNTMGEPTVGACLARNIKRWRFPKPKGGSATVEFPFIFTRAD